MKPGACARPKSNAIRATPEISDLNQAAKRSWTTARKKNSSTRPTSRKSHAKQSGSPMASWLGVKFAAADRRRAGAGEILKKKNDAR